MLTGLALRGQEGVDGLFRELAVVELCHRAIPVGRGGVVQSNIHDTVIHAAQEDTCRLAVTADQEGSIRMEGLTVEFREVEADVLLPTLEEVGKEAVVYHLALNEIEVLAGAEEADEIPGVDEYQTDIHNGNRIGADDQGIDDGHHTAHGVDHTELYQGCHEHGENDQRGAYIAHQLNDEGRIHNCTSFLYILK